MTLHIWSSRLSDVELCKTHALLQDTSLLVARGCLSTKTVHILWLPVSRAHSSLLSICLVSLICTSACWSSIGVAEGVHVFDGAQRVVDNAEERCKLRCYTTLQDTSLPATGGWAHDWNVLDRSLPPPRASVLIGWRWDVTLSSSRNRSPYFIGEYFNILLIIRSFTGTHRKV